MLLLALFAGKLNAQSYADSTIVYLEWMNDPTRTMIINWIEQDTSGIAEVSYRIRNSGDPWVTATGTIHTIPDASVKRKTVQITGLTPGTSYAFRIGSDSQSQFFRTMPANMDNTVRFVVTGDVYGDGTDPVLETEFFVESALRARQTNPMFAILAGDLVHLNEANEFNANTLDRYFKFLSEWTKYMKTPQDFHIPIVASLGNHELPQRFGGQPEDAKYFHALFNFPGTQGYRVLDFSDYLSLIVLNTDHTVRIEGAQTTWLVNQLNARRNVTNVFPVYHVAAYPGKREAVPGRGYEVRQHWSPIFEQYNIRFAFEHDNHGYKRTHPIKNDQIDPCGVRYIGEGGFAIPLGPVDTNFWYIEQQWNVRHFLSVELTPNNRRVQAIASATGFIIDAHSQSTRIAPPLIESASSVQATSFTARWNANCLADQYRLDVSTDPNFGSFVSGYNNRNVGNVTSFNVTGLSPLTQYYYRVRSVNSQQNLTSGNSNAMEAVTSSLPPVARQATAVSTTSFTANWDAVNGADQYLLDVSTVSNFSTFINGFEARNVGNNTSFNVTGLQTATSYYYRVRARSSISNQGSSYSIVIGLNTLPDAPVFTETTDIQSTQFRINWQSVPRTDYYYLDVSTDSTFSTFLTGYNNRGIGNVTSFSMENVQPLTRYFFRVRARNSNLSVTSANSAIGSVNTPSRPPVLQAPTSITSSTFTISWQPVTGVDRYIVDIATDSTFTDFLSGFEGYNNGSVTTLSINGLESATPHYIRVRASSSVSGLTSENSETVRAFTLPDIPVISSATSVSSRSFRANWRSVPRVDQYVLFVASDSLFNNLLPDYNGRVVPSDTTFIVEELSPNRRYFYRVRARSDQNNSIGGFSESMGVHTILDAPTGKEITSIGTEHAIISWDPVENAEKYILDIAFDADFQNRLAAYTDFDNGNETEFEAQGLESVERYYIRVRATNATRTITGPFGNSLVFTTIPYTPELLPPSDIKAVGFTAEWSEVDKASHYELDIAFDSNFTQPYLGFESFNVGDGNAYILRDVLPDTRLFYRVRAVNSIFNVESVSSEVQVVRTIAIDPNSSSFESDVAEVLSNGSERGQFTITVRDAIGNPLDGVRVTLTALSGQSIIEVVSDVSDDEGKARFTVRNSRAEFVTYRARAINVNIATEYRMAFIPVAPVTRPATQIFASTFVANWEPVSGATSYRLDVSEHADFSDLLTGFNDRNVGNETSFRLSGLYPGNEYFYRVRAVATTGTSQNSNVTVSQTPQADANLTEVNVLQSNVLGDGVAVGTVEIVVRGNDGQFMEGVPVTIETTDEHAQVITLRGISDISGNASFQVRSEFAGSVEFSVRAGRVEINTKALIDFIPVPPLANFPVLLGAVEFTASWEFVNGATFYRLDVSRDENFTQLVSGYVNLNVGNLNEFKVTGLAPGTTYYYRVRAGTNTSISGNSNTASVTTYQIDLENSTARPSANRILANGQQQADVSIKLISDEGDPLSDVLIILEPSDPDYLVTIVREITDSNGVAEFKVSSSKAGEATFRVIAGGLELDEKINILFLFADGEIKLGNNFPNPFSDWTKLPVTVPERMNIRLQIFNSSGLMVYDVADREYEAGYYEIEFRPRGLASGVYFVRMIANGRVYNDKMMLIK